MARLDAPENVIASDGLYPTVIITWDAVDGASSYAIYRSPTLDDEGYLIGITNELTWDDTTALLNNIYWYGAIARGGGNCSLLSVQNSGYVEDTVPPIGVPLSPEDLIAVVIV